MRKTPYLYLKSATCSVLFRLHGFQASLVACDGHGCPGWSAAVMYGSGTGL